MDLKQLERFVAVAEEGAFNKAAKRLSSSQPVLTRSVQLLEETLDLPLLERGPGGVKLTDHGRQLLPWARQLLNDHLRVSNMMQASRSGRPLSVAIGATSSFAGNVIPAAIAAVIGRYPGGEIRVVEGSLPSLLDRLRQGELDLAFGAKATSLDMDRLQFEPLVKERFEIITRAGHKALSLEAVTLRDLASDTWIIPDDRETVGAWEKAFSNMGLAPPSRVVKTTSHMLTGRLLAEGGFMALVGSMSFDHALATGSLQVVPLLATDMLRPAGLFSRIDREATANALTFAKSLRSACADWRPERAP